ncbi:hypothetical protein QRX83_13675 [Enterococcus hirae]|nr:hypothetical protein [Enterococcus hirae]
MQVVFQTQKNLDQNTVHSDPDLILNKSSVITDKKTTLFIECELFMN